MLLSLRTSEKFWPVLKQTHISKTSMLKIFKLKAVFLLDPQNPSEAVCWCPQASVSQRGIFE